MTKQVTSCFLSLLSNIIHYDQKDAAIPLFLFHNTILLNQQKHHTNTMISLSDEALIGLCRNHTLLGYAFVGVFHRWHVLCNPGTQAPCTSRLGPGAAEIVWFVGVLSV